MIKVGDIVGNQTVVEILKLDGRSKYKLKCNDCGRTKTLSYYATRGGVNMCKCSGNKRTIFGDWELIDENDTGGGVFRCLRCDNEMSRQVSSMKAKNAAKCPCFKVSDSQVLIIAGRMDDLY